MDFTVKTNFFDGCSWFKFNDLRLALGKALKFDNSVENGLILKFRKFWGLLSTFVEVTGEKLVGGPIYIQHHLMKSAQNDLKKRTFSQISSNTENEESIQRKWLEGKNFNLTSGMRASLFRSSPSSIETEIHLKHVGRFQAFFNLKIGIPSFL